MFKLKAKDSENREEIRKALVESHLVGWESNANGKLGPNIADLSDTMDPAK